MITCSEDLGQYLILEILRRCLPLMVIVFSKHIKEVEMGNQVHLRSAMEVCSFEQLPT